MQRMRILFGIVLLVVTCASKMASQEKTGPEKQSFPYNLDEQITLEGKIDQVKEYRCPVTGTVGSHITVTTAAGSTEVHLAPASFLKEYEMVIKSGESVKVLGVKIMFEGKPAMLARSITMGKETFVFRDSKGRPLW